jgi:hypothetical protein
MKKRLPYLLILLLAVSNLQGFKNKDEKAVSVSNAMESVSAIPLNTEKKTSSPNAPEKGVKDINSFIPNGWHIVEAYGDSKVEGDLNSDGIKDIAFVMEGQETSESAPPRVLLIATGNKDKSYNLAIKAETAIRRKDEGGIMGEPFMGLSIDRGSLLIRHSGGSAWRWDHLYRFRYQRDGWYLIGATEDWFHAVSSAGRKYEDINLLTGDYIKIETDDNGKEKITKANRGKKKLINLIAFDVKGKRQF